MTDTRVRPESLTVQLAAASAAPATASPSSRTIEGLAVPYGPVGFSSAGALTFSKGSLAWTEVGRVKLLKQHDPERSLGFATSLEEREDGLFATFQVAEGPEGDLALQEAADGRRDGLSVGVMLSDAVLEKVTEKWWNGDTSPTAAAGQLLEISQVSIPAFDDARTSGSAAASLSGHVTLSLAFNTTTPEAPASTEKENNDMDETIVTAAAAEVPAPVAPAPAPAAVAGAATQVQEAPVYTFDGRGPSFVRDVWHARFSMDRDSSDRLAEFNRQMQSSARQVGLVTAAVETRTSAPEYINEGYRPDMLLAAIDKGRPLTSSIGTITLTDATPFRIPSEGEFTGVGDHTEGTAHVAEGTLTAGDAMFVPGAVSGAYRLSRELIDATNPALDRIALNAMLRDYRRVTEAKVAAKLDAADATPTAAVNTVLELRAALNDYADIEDIPADFVFASKGFYGTLLNDVDADGRPMLPSLGVVNGVGQARAGYTGTHVDGTEIFKASSLSGSKAFLFKAEDVLIGESAVQTFRFDEVEGPGVVKLALWAYFGAAILRPSNVVELATV